MTVKDRIIPVILAGGSGTRLWPMSRRALPKQFLRLPFGSRHSLFQQAVLRVRAKHFAPPVVLGQEEHRFLIAEQLRELGLEAGENGCRIVLEPASRNTAPAALISALLCDDDDIVLLMPSDHHVQDAQGFRQAVLGATPAARGGDIVTFGVHPDRPETGYGYIDTGTAPEAGQADDEQRILRVRRFTEKPSRPQAEEYLQRGGYFWNAGIFLFRALTMKQAFSRHAPAFMEHCRVALKNARRDLDFLRLDEEAYRRNEDISVDYAIMEKADNIACMPLSLRWNDLGNWNALTEGQEPDENGNIVVGDALTRDAGDNLIVQADGGPLLSIVGMRGVLAVSTPDAVLIASREHCQDVRRVVEDLRAARREEAVEHRRVYRPWGWYERLAGGDRYQVKCLMVKPGARLSLQSHHHRAEHWVVVQGTVRVEREDESFLLAENESTFIPIGARHRLENPGRVPALLVEVQSGAYLGEDDIVRYEDLYGRINPEK